jgi:hypothetical protein
MWVWEFHGDAIEVALIVDFFAVLVASSKINRSVIVVLNLPSAMAINDILNFVWVSEPINGDLHTSLAR